MSKRKTMIGFGWIGATALAGACAATSVRTDYDRQTDFERYDTYAIRSGPLVKENDVADISDRVVRDRIRGALEDGLAGRGITPARQQSPDVIVTYSVTAMRDTELVETIGDDPNWSYGGHGVFPRVVDRGTLVIDVIDARDGQLVWRSIATAMDEDVRSAKFVERAVDKAMERFPPDTGS